MPCFTSGKGPRHMRFRNRAFHKRKTEGTPELTCATVHNLEPTHAQPHMICRGGPDSHENRQNTTQSRIYFESQERRHCVVHSWNNMHGRRDLSPDAVLAFMNSMWTAAERAGVLDLVNPHQAQNSAYCQFSGNYSVEAFNAFLLCHAIMTGESTAPQLVGAKISFWGGEPTARHQGNTRNIPPLTRANVLTRLGAVDALQLHFDTHAGYGHAACMRKVAGIWYLLDSESPSGPKRCRGQLGKLRAPRRSDSLAQH